MNPAANLLDNKDIQALARKVNEYGMGKTVREGLIELIPVIRDQAKELARQASQGREELGPMSREIQAFISGGGHEQGIEPSLAPRNLNGLSSIQVETLLHKTEILLQFHELKDSYAFSAYERQREQNFLQTQSLRYHHPVR